MDIVYAIGTILVMLSCTANGFLFLLMAMMLGSEDGNRRPAVGCVVVAVGSFAAAYLIGSSWTHG